MTDAANASTANDAAVPRVGFAGWARGLIARAGEPDIRQAAAITLIVVLAVIAVGRMPLHGALELDLRGDDSIGGWDQLTLVGFSINRPFGRFIPARPDRTDVRVISNRPLPAHFVLELTARTFKRRDPVELEVHVGDASHTHRFGAESATATLEFTNASGARTIELFVGAEGKLAVERIRIRSVDGGGA